MELGLLYLDTLFSDTHLYKHSEFSCMECEQTFQRCDISIGINLETCIVNDTHFYKCCRFGCIVCKD